MPTSRKIFTVQNLKEKFNQAKALVLADYSGLKVNQINELREEIKKAGGEFEVVKNSLLSLAAKDSKLRRENLALEGPTAVLWIYQEDPFLLKILDNFIKKTKLPKISGACSFRIKFGFWQGEQITLERVMELANLPSLIELKAKLVWTLNSPIANLARSLNFNLVKLIMVLKAKGGEI